MTTRTRIRVLVVDDHPLVRKGIASVLTSERDFDVVGEAADGQEAIDKACNLMPDVILMDISMPGVNGLEATRRIKDHLPYVHVIILTVTDDDQKLVEAIKGGAQGYLLKKVQPQTLFSAIRGVVEGEAFLSETMATKLLAEFSRQARRTSQPTAPVAGLTAREKEVLSHLAKGKANKVIAASLGIAESTVKNHLRNVLEKLHLQNRVQAVLYAVQAGLADKQP